MRTTVCRERFDPRRTVFDPSSGHDPEQCSADSQYVLGTLLVGGSRMSLGVPMAVTIAAYVAAIGLTLLATSRDRS
jgi:hypothetical protein